MQQLNRISLYWKCQLIFWSAAALQWGYLGYQGPGFSWGLAFLHFALDLLIYILPSHAYRNLSRRLGWQQLTIPQLLPRLLPSILVMGLLFMVLTITKNYAVRWFFQPGFDQNFEEAFRSQALTLFITGVRLMAIWLLAYYAYHYSQRELRAIKEAAGLELANREAAFQNLSAQLNPHFFFNSLNSIKALVIENPQAARRAIDILSDLLRTSLYSTAENQVSLEQELALVKDYLELEKIRFEHKLQIEINNDERLGQMPVPRLCIQTLAENAIKHGVSKEPGPGLIRIVVNGTIDQLFISVENNGRLQINRTDGIGLQSLRERLNLLYGDRAELVLQQTANETVKAHIKISAS